ncbi:helix-turn-helix domain-containing protein [Kitasatospora sp. NBC_01250]|uniref:TrmB family transcriptional regulator n=1 Tax=Kitasatospora sp. NBC_01250 TaxID=2903571 RepID=UPI002E3466E4|nr:helix-turn-helix domain-containing protein [Kitasatospora sp. NBC_01250]
MEIDDPLLAGAESELVELGLLVPGQGNPRTVTVTDPDRLAGRLTSAWQKQALALLTQAVAVPAAMQELGHAYQSLDRRFHPGGPVEHVHGVVEIRQRIQMQADGAEYEVLTAQPGGSARQTLAKAQAGPILEQDLALLGRGVARRIIYHPSTRYSAPAREYVEQITGAGAEVRTLEEPFTRLFIFDRRIALIPVQGDTAKAAFIRDEAIVAYLLDTYERMWERSSPFLGATEVPPEVISRMRSNILRMMTQGIGHRVIARNLGISERTLARYIADFREEYRSETLFQLGWRMALNAPEALFTGDDGAPAAPPQ